MMLHLAPVASWWEERCSVHHHLLEAISETANVLEFEQKLLHTTPSGVVAVVVVYQIWALRMLRKRKETAHIIYYVTDLMSRLVKPRLGEGRMFTL